MMMPTRLFPLVVKLPMTLRGTNSFRNRPGNYIRRCSILTGCRKFSWGKLKNWSAAEDRVTESCVAFQWTESKSWLYLQSFQTREVQAVNWFCIAISNQTRGLSLRSYRGSDFRFV